MEKRIAHKKSGNEIFPCNDRLRFIHQTVTMVFEFGTLFRWNIRWSSFINTLFSLFYHEKGAMSKHFVYFLFFKHTLVYSILLLKRNVMK